VSTNASYPAELRFLVTGQGRETNGGLLTQGQRTLNLVDGKDFREEVRAIATTKHLAANAVVNRMALEQCDSEVS
jgi:hypothetical protein